MYLSISCNHGSTVHVKKAVFSLCYLEGYVHELIHVHVHVDITYPSISYNNP